MMPLPLHTTPPVAFHVPPKGIGRFPMHVCVDSDTWMQPGRDVLSMRLAVLTVSPKQQKRGMRLPTTPLRSTSSGSG